MSDSDKPKLHTTPTESSEAEDEPIIDLVEEIEEDASSDALFLSDPSIPETDEPHPSAETADAGFVDLGELVFDEEEDLSESGHLALEPAAGDSEAPALQKDIDWLLAPGDHATATEGDRLEDAPAGEGSERRELNAVDPETEAILETLISPPAETGSGSEDEEIELIEIEDEDSDADDEIVWMDDLDLDQTPPAAEPTPEAEAPANPLSAADAALFPETSAADVFAANVASGLTNAETAPGDVALPAAIAASAAFTAPSTPAPPAAPEAPPVADGFALSDEQFDAALERVIERRLGATLESIVLRAVETAVAGEIQRLKALLLDEDTDNRIP